MASTTPALHSRGILLMLITTLIWGTSFPLIKQIIGDLSPAVLLAVRFMIAAVAVMPWLRSRFTMAISNPLLLCQRQSCLLRQVMLQGTLSSPSSVALHFV